MISVLLQEFDKNKGTISIRLLDSTHIINFDIISYSSDILILGHRKIHMKAVL